MFRLFKNQIISKEEIAEILKTSPKALEAFEKAYADRDISGPNSNDLFCINAKDAAAMKHGVVDPQPQLKAIASRIVQELLAQTVTWAFDGKTASVKNGLAAASENPVTKEEILAIPKHLRPQLTGHLMQRDTSGEPGYMLLGMYQMFKKETNPNKKRTAYHLFRQGLDIQDLDPIIYEILGMNQNSAGYWLPCMVEAVALNGFFKIPATVIIKVPMTLLQLTRLDYGSLTRMTLDIVDEYCRQAFDLNNNKEYFIKNGVFSSKYDFRNARVSGEKEVRELGEYLLYIHHQATMMAGPLSSPSIYGAATTNEWMVREFIRDIEGNPCIYHGLPLHTEYRVFVDFDSKRAIGMNPYWDQEVMKTHFGKGADQKNPHMLHDYAVYSMHEETLMKRYEENKVRIRTEVEALIQNVRGLSGQWSIDVMQNGNDFWIIDMAWAQNSALYDCVPEQLRIPMQENWIPQFNI